LLPEVIFVVDTVYGTMNSRAAFGPLDAAREISRIALRTKSPSTMRPLID
jgi:hypothetical protein